MQPMAYRHGRAIRDLGAIPHVAPFVAVLPTRRGPPAASPSDRLSCSHWPPPPAYLSPRLTNRLPVGLSTRTISRVAAHSASRNSAGVGSLPISPGPAPYDRSEK